MFWRNFELQFLPSCYLGETGDAITLDLDIPGVKEEDLVIMVESGILSVEAKRNGYEYRRAWPLPDSIDPQKIEGSYKNWVLTMVLPKKEAAKPRRIELKPQAALEPAK
jgi:HSP20 family protein